MAGGPVVEQVLCVIQVQCHVPVIHDVHIVLTSSPWDQMRDTSRNGK